MEIAARLSFCPLPSIALVPDAVDYSHLTSNRELPKTEGDELQARMPQSVFGMDLAAETRTTCHGGELCRRPPNGT
jgi:hypothetical protein